MATIIKTTFKLRRATLEQWTQKNPILVEGEPGYVLDTNQLKIGNGTSNWNELPYLINSDASVSPDGNSLTYNSKGNLIVCGFEDATINQVPIKDENGTLIWTTLSPVATSGLIDDLNQHNTIVLYSGGAPLSEQV